MPSSFGWQKMTFVKFQFRIYAGCFSQKMHGNLLYAWDSHGLWPNRAKFWPHITVDSNGILFEHTRFQTTTQTTNSERAQSSACHTNLFAWLKACSCSTDQSHSMIWIPNQHVGYYTIQCHTLLHTLYMQCRAVIRVNNFLISAWTFNPCLSICPHTALWSHCVHVSNAARPFLFFSHCTAASSSKMEPLSSEIYVYLIFLYGIGDRKFNGSHWSKSPTRSFLCFRNFRSVADANAW